MSLSSVQNHIISLLKNAKSLRYSEMKPVDVENDSYNYHLQALVAKDLVAKSADGYSLSENGKKYVADERSTSDSMQNRLFKINVITIVSRINGESIEILQQQRESQPSYGKIGVPGGTIVKEETYMDGASRKLTQETGLTASFRLLGFERRILYKNDEFFSDVLFPICYSALATGDLQTQTEFGKNLWVPVEEAISNENATNDKIDAIVTCLEYIRDDRIDELQLFSRETNANID